MPTSSFDKEFVVKGEAADKLLAAIAEAERNPKPMKIAPIDCVVNGEHIRQLLSKIFNS